MKTTLDIPDSIYREFKMKTAMNGETMKNATIAFIIAYNTTDGHPFEAGKPAPRVSRRHEKPLPEWAGMAEPYITRYPTDPLDSESIRDDIVSAMREDRI